MKKAFTMMELVFVIVVIGILAAVIIPRVGSNKLNEAALQVIAHIRYTQHLAMVDDKFGQNTNATVDWYKKRWQIQFNETLEGKNVWAYTIYRDETTSGNANSKKEIAKNPQNPNQYMSGGAAGFINLDDIKRNKKMALRETYDVTDVSFSNCGSTARRITFDHLGRPLFGNPSTANSIYERVIVNKNCTIRLTHSNGKTADIAIEPETGYTHIL
ncbi:type II secretion system protein [Sulfurimonas sp.]|jgi:prepilin-type N-terminal cleavage/methylation domain-containing protein|uniref:pilus assembly FimT family protein n=1 Tax=Sulfurimonas sp. TaxID=2022749 RepID=UPI0025E59A27|nr:type II secretion system protein [Sulfurimonas sp.]MCK9473148.1 type II secretion system GspH family protein [Sulfurimonas sp.]